MRSFHRFSLLIPLLAITACSSGNTTTSSSSVPNMTLNWSTKDLSFGNAFLSKNLLFSGRTLRAMNLDTHQFAFQTNYPISMEREAYAEDGDHILAVTNDKDKETLRVLDRQGNILNSIKPPAGGWTGIGQLGPYVTQTAVYLASGGTVSRYNRADLLKADAQPVWSKTYPGLQLAALYAPDDDHVYLNLNDNSNQFIALDGQGNERWRTRIAPADTVLGASYVIEPYKNTLIIEAGAYGLKALDKDTGKLLWDKEHLLSICPTNTTVTNTLTIADDMAYIGPFGGTCILAFHADTGESAWVFNSPNQYSFDTYPVYIRGVVYATNDTLYALDGKTGALLAQGKEELGGNGGRPLIYNPATNELLMWGLRGLFAYQPLK